MKADRDSAAAEGSRQPPAAPARRGRSRLLRSECRLHGTLVLDGKRVPTGDCWVGRSRQHALLCWADADGAAQQRELSLDQLDRLLHDGVLERLRPA